MGVGEALAISESDTFALTQVADRDCRMPEALRPAEGSPVVPASKGGPSPRRTCIQAIVKNVEVMTQRVHASGAEAYRGLVDLVASLRETPGPKTIVLVSAGFAIALDAGVFDELAIRAALSDVVVDAVLVEPVAAPNSRRLVPANIISERRSLMRRLTELAGSALGTAHSAVGGSQESFDRLMTVDGPVPPGRASRGGRDAGRRREGRRGGHGRRLEREGAAVLRPTGAARRDRRGDAGRAVGARARRHPARGRAAGLRRGRLPGRSPRGHRGAADRRRGAAASRRRRRGRRPCAQ